MSRRLFEQPENNDPVLSKRVAFGAASQITENMTWTNFIIWITDKLPFLKTTNNLSDLGDAPTARTNLGVYSSGETDTLLDDKANTIDVLEKTNTVVFVPTSDYHPATFKFVNEGGTQEAFETATKVSGSLTASAFMRCARVGPWTCVTGIMELSSIPSENTVLFTLPVSFPVFTETWYFNASDGNSDENYEMKAAAGTRNILQGGGGSTGTEAYYGTSIPVI